MSAITPSGYSYMAQVSSYAGALRNNSDSDAARTNAAQRAVESDHRAMATAELHEATESERPSDRDADGFYASSGASDGSAQEVAAAPNAEGEASSRERKSRRSTYESDDYRGQLLDVQV